MQIRSVPQLVSTDIEPKNILNHPNLLRCGSGQDSPKASEPRSEKNPGHIETDKFSQNVLVLFRILLHQRILLILARSNICSKISLVCILKTTYTDDRMATFNTYILLSYLYPPKMDHHLLSRTARIARTFTK